MPATTIFGLRLKHLASDFSFMYFNVAFPQVLWFLIYVYHLATLSQPEDCGRPHQYIVFWVLIAIFVVQAVLTVITVWISLIGTPLEPSRRRWQPLVSEAFLVSVPAALGFMGYSVWALLQTDDSCWSTDRRTASHFIISGFSWEAMQPLGIFLIYQQLCDVYADKWHSIFRKSLSWVLHFWTNWGAQYRWGPYAPYEEMAREMQDLLKGVEADKTDAVASLACAAMLQTEALAAAAAAPGTAAGAPAEVSEKQQGIEGGLEKPLPGDSSAGEEEEEGNSAGWRQEVLAWAGSVCSAAQHSAASAAAAKLIAAGAEEAGEVLRWARFAMASYGERLHGWQRGETGVFAASRQLKEAREAAAAAGAQPLAGWAPSVPVAKLGNKGGCGVLVALRPGSTAGTDALATKPPSKAVLEDFVAAQQLLGGGGEIVAFCSGHERSGLLPHIVAIDRERQTVILGIADVWEQPPLPCETQPLPPAWLASSSAAGSTTAAAAEIQVLSEGVEPSAVGQESGDSPNLKTGGTWVHADSLKAAQKVWAELESSQVLQRLLRVDQLGASTPAQGGAEGLPSLPDCRGWQLVLTGHGLGAGAAALLALKLRTWHPRVAVWAFSPPGQLCSAELATELAGPCSMTSVVVGDDFAPRNTQEAQHRYTKTGLQLAMLLEGMSPKRYRGRWLIPGKALRPLGQVPEEPLTILKRYLDWSKEQDDPLPCTLPGRVLLLERAAAAAGTFDSAASKLAPTKSLKSSSIGEEAGAGKASGDANTESSSWQAWWLTGEQLREGGITVSKSTVIDHWASRLLGVLGDLAAADGGEGSGAGAC